MAVRDLGIVTAYGYAVAGGYTGTEQEFTALLGDLALTVEDLENMTVSVTTLEPNQQATASYADGVLSLGIPKGVAGEVQFSDLEPLAEKDGNYENFTAGSALQLISDKYTENKEPYLFRKSGGGKSIGNREIDTLVGGSVVWNQLVPTEKRNFTSETSDTKSYFSFQLRAGVSPYTSYWSQNISAPMLFEKIVTANAGTTNAQFLHNGSQRNIVIAQFNCDMFANHKYLFSVDIKGADVQTVGGLVVNNIQLHDLTVMFGTTIADRLYTMEQANAGSGIALFRSWFPKDYYAYNAGELMSVKPIAHEMVGFNQWDEEWRVGGLNTTTGATTAETDRICSKNFIPVMSNTVYVLRASVGGGLICCYDSNKAFISSIQGLPMTPASTFTTPSGCAYIKFGTYANYGNTYRSDICISISSDRNGEYEPYTKHTYALDDVELRGVPKLDASNNVYFDGDTYEADGTVTRKYASVDMGTLTWYKDSTRSIFQTYINNRKVQTSISDPINIFCQKYVFGAKHNGASNLKAILPNDTFGITYDGNNGFYIRDDAYTDAATFKTAMSGVYLVYELATPTTETADPFTNPQIVDAYGTERYVDERTVAVPVGHVTKYPDNLREKLDGLPWDFSTLIAPTEKAYTATRNYTTGSLLIVNNVLYKVTANIANGGAITPNTNVVATTLSEVISAL